MADFIPLTGGGSIAQQIIDRFQDEPGFDFISYADAQQVTGELFRELIGPDFEPYKDLATYADIQADANAIALADANANVQKVIEGIQETVSGFAIEAPGFDLLLAASFIYFEITPTVATPEQHSIQYRIDNGNWVTVGSGFSIETYSVLITDTSFDTNYKIEVRQSLFGTQSIIGTHQVTTDSDLSGINQEFLDSITSSQTTLNSFINEIDVFKEIISTPLGLTSILSSPYALNSVWDDADASVAIWEAGTPTPPATGTNSTVLTLENSETSRDGKGLNVETNNCCSDFVYYTLNVDLTNINSLTIFTQKFNNHAGSSGPELAVNSTVLFAEDSAQTSPVERTHDVSSFTGVCALNFKESNKGGNTSSANYQFADLTLS